MKWIAMNLQSIFHFVKEKQTIQAKKVRLVEMSIAVEHPQLL